MANRKPAAISLFSGALGLDLGIEKAGFEIRVAVECDPWAVATIRKNRPGLPVIDKRIEDVTTREILEAAGLEPGEATILIGGPCCQSFSTAGRRHSIGDPRGKLFRQFLRVVNEARPRFFIMENVRGILSAAVKHRPLDERGPGFPILEPAEEFGSAFTRIASALQRTGYFTVFDLLNAADFGVPQRRERLFFIGSRDGELIQIPKATHSKKGGDGLRTWSTLRKALRGLRDPNPLHPDIIPSKRDYMRLIPPGGNWRDLPKRMQEKAIGSAYKSWGGRSGFLRRLAWDETPPAVTTAVSGSATLMCHPRKLRPLSLRECKRLQQFPDSWKFEGGIGSVFVQVGNAVPVGLGHVLGNSVMRAMKDRARTPKGVLSCRQSLLIRLINGNRTKLNPRNMRRVKNIKKTKEWLACKGRPPYRLKIRNLVTATEKIVVLRPIADTAHSRKRAKQKAYKAAAQIGRSFQRKASAS
jgi:DNA (cytosine-5)-methyltransferase 1